MSSVEFAPTALKFVEDVLATQPRIAVFDCDGTLWSGDCGSDFFHYEINCGFIPADVAKCVLGRYADYKAGKVDELSICGEMVTIHKGLQEADIRRVTREFFSTIAPSRFFGELRELTHRLKAEGCEVWACSSTNNWVVEEGTRDFGIPPERVLAACVEFKDGVGTDRLIRVPTDELKAVAIREVIGRPVDAVFGNSIHDLAMLELARNPYAINPNPDLEALARERGWVVYHPER